MIFIYSQWQKGRSWLQKYRGKNPCSICILGFTATALIPGISAAGTTPSARKLTALADGEFLLNGVGSNPRYPLPYLTKGISPAFISRGVVEKLKSPLYVFNAGLLESLPEIIDLGGKPANCLSSGKAMEMEMVKHLFQQGLEWGEKLSQTNDYLVIGESVVGGTTTALAILKGLGFNAVGMVNSSHRFCNHDLKLPLVERGLTRSGLSSSDREIDPFFLVSAVGDPMQIVAASMAISASRNCGVMLAGGTQMLAVYALIEAISNYYKMSVNFNEIVVGTTRWVCEDRTGNAIELARIIGGVPFMATSLNFSTAKYPNLRFYELGYVKEGVGAGGFAIAAHLKQGLTTNELLTMTENLFDRYQNLRFHSIT